MTNPTHTAEPWSYFAATGTIHHKETNALITISGVNPFYAQTRLGKRVAATMNATIGIQNPSAIKDVIEALERAVQFMENGIEFGYIHVPTDPMDKARETLPLARQALTTLKGE